MPIIQSNRVLTPEEKRKLLTLVEEAKNRGINIDIAKYNALTIIEPFVRDERGFFIKANGKHYNPVEFQQNFYSSQARFVGLYGSRGCGKSSSGSQKALNKIESGESGMVLNPDFENFKTSTWQEFRDWIPWKNVIPRHQYKGLAEYEPQKPFVLIFNSGARVLCKGLKDPNSARGPNMNWLWYDEAQRDETGEAWKIAVACIRVGKDPQAWATYTPRGSEHWTTKFFLNEEIPQEVIDLFAELGETRPLLEVYHGTMLDNKDNLDPGFYASMMMAYEDGYMREREVFGNVADEGGALGHREWFDDKIVDEVPFDIKSRIRYWDLAGSEKKLKVTRRKNDPDENVGSLLDWDGGRKFCLEDQVCGRWDWASFKKEIVRVAEKDGSLVRIYIEQEPGSGGVNQVEELKLYIKEHCPVHVTVEGHRPEGDKVVRALPWFEEAKNGFWYLKKGNWNKGFLDQLSSFPIGAHDDRVDSPSGARQIIAPFKTWKDIGFIAL
jgi:predicted phage terminase large subunit-like protein